MKPVIEVKQLWKEYRIGGQEKGRYLSLRDTLTGLFKARAPEQSFWALKDVDFSIQPGETVGIVGRNGAGKSTLLKILSGITPPTKGEINIRGRIASLLEVGTGFHPELTGRENIFLNGSILGLKRAEIAKKFDEIVAFSGVETFLDTPLKRYSSGMQLRLAFSVAAHLEPEILLIDEVLAVGDAEFQKKCLGKMDEVSRSGRTILLVSHNLAAVRSLCTRGILLQSATVAQDGPAGSVIATYLSQNSSTAQVWEGKHQPNGILQIERISVESNGYLYDLSTKDPVRIRIEFEASQPAENLCFEVWCYYEDGSLAFCSYTQLTNVEAGKGQACCTIAGDLLNSGRYTCAIGLSQNYVYAVTHIPDAVAFDVHKYLYPGDYDGKDVGALHPRLKWEVMIINKL